MNKSHEEQKIILQYVYKNKICLNVCDIYKI